MPFTSDKDIAKLADELESGKPASKALLAAGYSKHQSKKGKSAFPTALYKELNRRGSHYIALGKQYRPEDRADLVRGRLLENALEGKDKAVRSLELLGKDIEVGIFKPDSTNVAVQINVPAAFAEALKTINLQSEPE